MISTRDMSKQVYRSAIMGKKKPVIPEVKIKLSDKIKNKIKNSRISESEFLTMLVFAREQPSGNRKLKLNYSELSKQLTDQPLNKQALEDRAGINRGGKASMAKTGTKGVKLLDQRNHLYNIKNLNRVQNPKNATQGDYNPNYTSFKNQFVIK